MSKRGATDARTARGACYNLLFAAAMLMFAAVVGYQLLNQTRTAAVAPSSDAPTGATLASTLGSETDLLGLRAAETGQLGQPALVWFHADW